MADVKNAFVSPVPDSEYDASEKPVVDVDMSPCREEEKPRMISLINRLARSPIGLETLRIAKEGGFTFSFFDGTDVSCCGACDEAGKWIKLNPVKTDDKLVGTLCHESRHAGQFVRGAHEKYGVYDVRSELIMFRAIEADAQTYAIAACNELRFNGDGGPYHEFKRAYPEIEGRFMEALIKTQGDVTNEVMTETFKGWYDQKRTKTSYEESYQVKPMQTELSNLMIGREPTLHYTKQMSGADIIAIAGWTENGNYFTDDPAVLEQGHYIEVADTTMKALKNFFKAREALTGAAPDPSIETLPTRTNKRPTLKAQTYTSAQQTSGAKERIEAVKREYAVRDAAVKRAVAAKRAR